MLASMTLGYRSLVALGVAILVVLRLISTQDSMAAALLITLLTISCLATRSIFNSISPSAFQLTRCLLYALIFLTSVAEQPAFFIAIISLIELYFVKDIHHSFWLFALLLIGMSKHFQITPVLGGTALVATFTIVMLILRNADWLRLSYLRG
jgi:hypothetical protein